MKRWGIAILCLALGFGMVAAAEASPYGTYDATIGELKITSVPAGDIFDGVTPFKTAVEDVLSEANAAIGDVRSLILDGIKESGTATLDYPGDWAYIGSNFKVLEKVDYKNMLSDSTATINRAFRSWNETANQEEPAAFSTTLREVILPPDIMDITSEALNNYPALTYINTEELTNLARIWGWVLALDAVHNGGSMKVFTIPAKCLQIMDNAFKGRYFDVLALKLLGTAIPLVDENYDTKEEIMAIQSSLFPNNQALNKLAFIAALAGSINNIYQDNMSNGEMVMLYSYFGIDSNTNEPIFPENTVFVCTEGFKAGLQNWLDIIAAWEEKAESDSIGFGNLWDGIASLFSDFPLNQLPIDTSDITAAVDFINSNFAPRKRVLYHDKPITGKDKELTKRIFAA